MTTKKTLTKKQILETNKNNPCFLRKCPSCSCDVIDQQISQSKIFNKEAWISNCPKCNYSFCE